MNDELISVDDFCRHNEIELSFIYFLSNAGIVELIAVDELSFIRKEQVCKVEKMMRFHYDMDINLEGLEAIANLLEQLDRVISEKRTLQNRLDLYEHT